MAAWESFYVLVGSGGAALIGMQFVVITLVADSRLRPSPEAVGAFATPTVLHMTMAMLVSATLAAPWHSLHGASLLTMVYGLGGLIYGLIAIRRMLRQRFYAPVWEDWLWYAALPCADYIVLIVGAILLRGGAHAAPFVIAAATVGLLLIGIHNAWDVITDIVLTGGRHGGH